MVYVEVIVASATYHKNEPLTYSSEKPLAPGSIVLAPLRQKDVLAIVINITQKPSFQVKPITAIPALAPLPKQQLELLDWMRAYYPAPLGITAGLFLPKQLPKDVPAPELPTTPTKDLPDLTEEQTAALKQIDGPGLHILHGETGSGKTRVYIELTKRSLEEQKSAIILTPEIGLTSQLAKDFRSVFGAKVFVIHSGLTETRRRQQWQLILERTEPVVIIGARSALFSPVKHLGLIVVDEAHETSYKQDQAPYYHATTVSAKLAALHGATLVLGSATPLVSDYYIAEQKHRPIIRMTKVATDTEQTPPSIALVDLKNKSLFSKSPYLSDTLVKAIRDALGSKEQALLFLNRRGTARVVFCEQCGWQAACPHCDLPLVYHGDHHRMRCHSCNFATASPTSCPSCGNASVVFKAIGTKAIVETIERLFPEARVMRFDSDNKKSERLEQHYTAVHSGDVDILVGTQALAKGLDLPRLALVGVVIADTSLYFPDFTAQERTYQLLSQVVGRVGRGHRKGTAIIQTYAPESPLLDAIIHKDWGEFYNNELAERRQFLFPPFCYILKLTCKRATSQSAQKAAEQLAEDLRNRHHHILVEGPSPSFHEKEQRKFLWQIIIKTKQRTILTDIIGGLPSGWSYDIDPLNLL